MLQCPVSEWPEKTIGQKVSIKNKNGTLRFVGTTNFASGIWCGIELDEAAGENDGMVNNVQYFTCRKNHGIFIPSSDLVFIDNSSVENNLMSTDHFSDRLSNTNFNAKNCNSTVTLNDSQSVSPEILDKKSKSYTISNDFPVGKLSTINEEMVESIHPNSVTISCLDITKELNKCNTSFKEVCGSSIQKQENSVFHQSFEEYDSDDSLGLLPSKILESTEFGDSSVFEIDYTKQPLNSTVNLLSSSENELKYQNLTFHDNDNEFLFPSTSIMAKYPILSKNEECPPNTPKFSSTPKHEINYSYIIDEEAVDPSENFMYYLESPINSSETFLGKHLGFVLNKTTEMALNSENISFIISNEYKSRNDDNRHHTPDILNTTCVISDPVNENLIPHNKLNYLAVEGCSVKSRKDSVKFSIGDHPLPNYNNTIQNIVSNALDATADCYSQGNEEDENILSVTCNILEPKQIVNNDENILNVTCNILEPKQIGSKDDENILNVTCNILEPKQIGSEDDENILNVTCNIFEPKQIANHTENFDDKNCIPTNILNVTVSYSDIAENNNIANDKAGILNTTVSYSGIAENNKISIDKAGILNTTISYSGIAENNKIANDKAEILNTTVSYSGIDENKILNDNAEILNTTLSYLEKLDDSIVENVSADILNTTYKKIEESCELDGNVKILKTVQPPFGSNENVKLQFGAKNNDVTHNLAFKMNSSVCKEGSRKICSIFDKQSRKSVGCFVKPNIVNAEYKNKAHRNSVSSSLCATSKAGESAVNKARRNSLSSSLCPMPKAGESTVNKARRNSLSTTLHSTSKADESTVHCFNKNLHGKYPVETKKTARKSFFNCNRLPNNTARFNTCRNAFKCLSLKSNFAEDNHEIIDPISKDKFKDRQVFNETKSFSAVVPDVCKTVVKKPRFSVQNFSENNPEIIDSIAEVNLNDGQVFNESENFPTLLPDVRKTVVKKSRFSMQRFTGCEHGKTNLVSEIKDGQVFNETKSFSPLVSDGCKTVVKKPRFAEQNFTENNPEIIDSIAEVNLNDGQVFNESGNFPTLLPDVRKTVVKKSRFSMQRFTGCEHGKTNLVSEIKDGQVFNETKSFSPLVSDGCKTVVKKPRCSVHNFTENNPVIIDSIPEVNLNDGQVFNDNENFSTLLPAVEKTVVKKSQFSMQRFTGYEHGKTNLVSEIKDGQIFKQTKNHVLPDVGKTVVKKSQCSANFGYKSNSQGPCKKPLFKPQSNTVATASENKSLKLPANKEKELPVQKPFQDSVIPCLKRPVFSAATSDGKNHLISRIPGKSVLSQKNILANSTSMETNNTNLHKPHGFIPAGKMNTKQGVSNSSALKSLKCLPATKSDLTHPMPIPDQENKFKQTSQTTKTSCDKEIDQTSARNCQNSDPNSTKKACLNETVIVPNKNEETQNSKPLSKSTKPVSRIPSISQKNRKADSGVKSSLMIPRIAYKGKSHSQQNIR